MYCLNRRLLWRRTIYASDAPITTNGLITTLGESGTRLIISGIIKTLDCTKIIPNTELDLWQTNDAGTYDENGFYLRAKVISNSQGFYSFETILPGKYLSLSRPRHIHVKITTPGFSVFTTQIYFKGDTSISTDPAASISSGHYDASHRIIPLDDKRGILEGTWDIVIDGNGTLGVSNLHVNTGMIYNISPNPFTDEIRISYGVFKLSNIKIEVYNIQGQLMAKISEKNLKAEKYTAIWKPKIELVSGIYFCVLKVNDLQVHYKKIIKK